MSVMYSITSIGISIIIIIIVMTKAETRAGGRTGARAPGTGAPVQGVRGAV